MQKSDYKNMWVYREHDGKTAASVGLELCCELRRLCDITGDKLYAVILDKLPASEVDKVKACGIDGIIQVTGTGYEYFNTDAYANAFTVLSRKYTVPEHKRDHMLELDAGHIDHMNRIIVREALV